MKKIFTTNLTNQHELTVRKPFLIFKYHEIYREGSLTEFL